MMSRVEEEEISCSSALTLRLLQANMEGYKRKRPV